MQSKQEMATIEVDAGWEEKEEEEEKEGEGF